MNRNELTQKLTEYLKLSPSGSEELKHDVKFAEFATSNAVIHKGQTVSGAYIVLSGQLRVYTYMPQGNEATLYLIQPGETCVLALNCLFNDLRYPAWVETAPNTQVAVIPGALYKALFTKEKNIQDMTVKALSTIVFRLMNELEQIHSLDLSQRLADFLLNNASESGEVKMTQQNLADHLGTSREVIARLMQNYTSKGYLTTRRGKITINDAKAMSEILKTNQRPE